MINTLYEKFKKFIKENGKFLCTLLFLFVFFFYELPFVIYRPGGVIPLNERIQVAEEYTEEGTISMAYVSMMKGNIPFVLLSFVIPNWDLVPSSAITLENESVDDTIKRDRLYLEEGLDNAIISAYTLAGKEIKIDKTLHVITYITQDAKTNLQVGDILVKVDGQEFSELKELQDYINSLEKDAVVHFDVLRDDKEIECDAKIYEIQNSLKVGISMINKYVYEETPEVTIESKRSESGSSGGLMTSLAVYNAVTNQDITKGRNIVGTGTIDVLGNVGEIGGVKYKLLGAVKNHADIFLCPMENYKEAMDVKKKNKLDIEIVKVATLEEAIRYLEK